MDPTIHIAAFSGHNVRYIQPTSRQLLFNAKDIFGILDLELPDAASQCLDIAEAISLSRGRNPDLASWLMANFPAYDVTTNERPNCDPEWITFAKERSRDV